jgi:hypothetical protein
LRNPKLKKRIERAIELLEKYNPPMPEKWDTKKFGEIPADFGRK